jgi:lysyl endopeptidase
MPTDLHQRYLDLYKNFGDFWRVTDKTSLFDYAPGTSTATFTQPTWPPQNPPCSVPGETPVS